MPNKTKILDFMTAGVVFASAVNELISYIRCRNEHYIGEVKGSDYLINGYPQHSTIQGILFASFLMFLIMKFSACIYTRIIVWVFFTLQVFNGVALIFKFGFEVYDIIIYPIVLFTIITLAFIKFLRWGSQKHL
jgi:hypothetical protein